MHRIGLGGLAVPQGAGQDDHAGIVHLVGAEPINPRPTNMIFITFSLSVYRVRSTIGASALILPTNCAY